MSIHLVPSDAAIRLRSASTAPRRTAGVIVGTLAVAVAGAALCVALGAVPMALPWAGLAVAVAAFGFGRAADGPFAVRWAVAGAVVTAAGAALAASGSALAASGGAPALIGTLTAAAAAGCALPAAFALLAVGVPARRTWTPRYRLPMPLPVSGRRRRAFRFATAGAVLAGALVALVQPLGLGSAWGVAAEMAGAAGLVATASVAVRIARPTMEAETVGAVLAAGGIAMCAVGLAALGVGAVLPAPAAAGIAGAVAIAGAAGILPRAHGRARLAKPRSRAYRRAVGGYELNRKLVPATAAVARTANDVVALVAEARQRGLGVRTHSTGHRASITGPMDDAALVRVLLDEAVTVDRASATARVPAGAKWGDVVEAVAPHGFGVPHGSSPDVGVVGYVLRGGLSFYGRGRGVAANSVVGIELVTADGVLRAVDAEHDPELFWALRGGGGSFGVVTAVTLRLFPLIEVVTGTIVFDVSQAQAVARAWHEWALRAPAEITTSLRIVDVPKLPGIPRSVAGRRAVVVDGIAHRLDHDGVEPADAATDLVAALTAVAEPLFDSWAVASPHEAPYTHMDTPFGFHHSADHLLLRGVDADGLAAFVAEAVEGTAMCELRQLGGALAHEPLDGGAVALFDADFAYFSGKFGALDDATSAEFARLRATLEPWDTGRIVPTFEGNAGWSGASFDSERAERVRAVRRRVDPQGVFAGDATDRG